MSKPRGNPNWCAPQLPSSADPTVSAFELQTKKLGLRPDDFVGSEDLKEWARKNKDQKFPITARVADGQGLKVEEELPSVLPEAGAAAGA